MNSELVQLLGLIALRSLVEYDPVEYWRSVDLSKAELDERIGDLLERTEDEESRQLVQMLAVGSRAAHGPYEGMLLQRYVYNASLSRARYLAVREMDSEQSWKRYSSDFPEHRYEVIVNSTSSSSADEELLRLGTMALLQRLPGYTPIFGYRLGLHQIDCALEPHEPSGMQVFVTAVRTPNQYRAKLELLMDVLRSARQSVIGLMLVDPTVLRFEPQRSDNIVVLAFDVRSNRFVSETAELFSRMEMKG